MRQLPTPKGSQSKRYKKTGERIEINGGKYAYSQARNHTDNGGKEVDLVLILSLKW